MISVTQALSFIAKNRPETGAESVPLSDALGRRLAQDITAQLTHPPLDASAMDGYAVQLCDIDKPGAVLSLIGEAPAGAPFLGTVGAGQAVRIFTGGAIPKGADTVIIQENVSATSAAITVIEPQDRARHIRRAGLDFKTGQHLLSKGAILTPADIAVAAASGHAHLSVIRKLQIAIISGGNELVPPSETPKIGQIVNSNPYALAALFQSWGHEADILPTAKDTLESLSRSIELAKGADVIVPVGGASVGDHDHMRAAFQSAGLKMIFEKIAVRPGKPTWFGTLQDRCVLGLPGNPASALVCAQLFLKPLLTGEPLKAVKAKLKNDLAANGPRESYQRAIITQDADGTLTVSPLPIQDSGLMTPFLIANALLKLPPNQPSLNAGELVEVLLIKSLV